MLRSGERFDRYTIEALLGEGGMGCVYRAFDERLHRRVALKVMRYLPEDAGVIADGDAAARLFREARAAAALMHPNIVVVHDVGEVSGVPFIAMEHVNGRTLRAHMTEDVPMPTRLRWLGEVARALAAAHRAGLVHRDVKPENVLVSDEGMIKMLDFGIARYADTGSAALGRRSALEIEGPLVGTPQYMAPEQFENRPVDGRSDQFSWGVVAYEMIAHKPPWRGMSWPELVKARSQEPAPLGAAVAVEVEAVVRRTLRRRPDERFASMNEVVSALLPRPPVDETIVIESRDIIVFIDAGPPTVEKQRNRTRETLELASRYPAGVGFLMIIDPQSPAPDAEVRREIDQVLADLSPCLRALAWVVLGDGLQAGIVRAVVSSLYLGKQRSYPTTVMSDLHSALRWLLPFLDGGAARLGELDEHLAAIQRAL